MKIDVSEVHYHRNGSAGDGFRVVTFDQGTDGRAHMVAVVGAKRGDVRVLNARRVAAGIASDTFDGPEYEEDLRIAILTHEEETLAMVGRKLEPSEVFDLRYGEHACEGSHGVMCLPLDKCVVCGRDVPATPDVCSS